MGPGFVEFLTLQNPGTAAATALLTFQASDDSGNRVNVPSGQVSLPSVSRVTVNINDYLAANNVRTPVNLSVAVDSGEGRGRW